MAREESVTPEFLATVREFRRLLAHHFDIEEVIVGGAGFDSTSQHQDRHRQILADIDLMIDQFDTDGSAAPRHEAVDHMERVLFDHEIVEDTQYWEFLRDHRTVDVASPLLEWKPEYAIGVDWIDDQHRTLLQILAKVIACARSADGLDEAGLLLEVFLVHTRRHFADEEHELVRLGRSVTEHRKHHRGLLDGLTEMTAAAKANPEALASDYLTFWLLDHIRGIDRIDFAVA
jgi:hemerythrin